VSAKLTQSELASLPLHHPPFPSVVAHLRPNAEVILARALSQGFFGAHEQPQPDADHGKH
jgi:hypothetical protein